MVFVLDREGGAEVLKEIAADAITELANQVAASAGAEAVVTSKVSKTRFVATVKVPAAAQAKDGVLSRAAAQAGLLGDQEDAADGYEEANLNQPEGEAKVPAKRGRPRKAD